MWETATLNFQDHEKLTQKVAECLEDYNSVSKIRMARAFAGMLLAAFARPMGKMRPLCGEFARRV